MKESDQGQKLKANHRAESIQPEPKGLTRLRLSSG